MVLIKHAVDAAKLASVTKSNAQKYSRVFWDELTQQIAQDYPDVEATSYHIDAIAARMVMAPESLAVIVASNLFGDILTALSAAFRVGLDLRPQPTSTPTAQLPRCLNLYTARPPMSPGKASRTPSR